MDSFSSSSHFISSLHDLVMVVVIFIISLVGVLFFTVFSMKNYGRNLMNSEVLEVFWTVLPCLVLGGLSIPSLIVLYLSEESEDPLVTLKVIGHQWFWEYEYGDLPWESFGSYMIPSKDLWEGGFRLLEVDKRPIVPSKSEVRIVVSSSDVIHSWGIPSLGVKMDAIPGRLNQFSLYSTRSGIVYGQCSEICGTFHSFMPIVVEIVPFETFLQKE